VGHAERREDALLRNSANGMPLTRDTMIAARLKPVLL
jgi:hypothetical protein